MERVLARWDAGTLEGQALLILLRSAASDPAAATEMRELFTFAWPALRRLITDKLQRRGNVQPCGS